MKLRLYPDTSDFNLRFDERSPERHRLTCEFFDRSDGFLLATSEAARAEIQRAADDVRRGMMLELLSGLPIHPVTDEMRRLAASYLTAGVFTPAMEMDALHVAAAVISQQDILVSWNFKHLVNRRRRGLINMTNAALGFPLIEIMAPPEV